MSDLIDKIRDYQNERKETLDWIHHNFFDSICNDIIEIVEEEK
ncbi:hypothetical protein [Vagococcus fluvialis]|nr:hypothetical protein [Vagococcus fluvialis]